MIGRREAVRPATNLCPDGANFCPSCGQSVGTPHSGGGPDVFETLGIESEQERRYLTAVFCDLVGSTELSTTIDPEEFTELIEAYQQQAVAVARRFAGDVEGYSGDGISFRFGWPEAHDDDAAQALRAALEIVASVEELDPAGRLRLRAGVHSGLAVVGEMGGSGRAPPCRKGRPSTWRPGCRRSLSPGRWSRVPPPSPWWKGSSSSTRSGRGPSRGFAEPIAVFRVMRPTGVRSRLEAAAGRLTPFVGRRAALDVLSEKWSSAAAGRGAAVLLRGEPGVGKSRLADQLRDVVSGQPYSWIDCSCSPYTQMSVLWPVARLIEQGLGLLEDDDPQTRLDRLRSGLGTAGVDLPDAVELVAALLGLVHVEAASMAPRASHGADDRGAGGVGPGPQPAATAGPARRGPALVRSHLPGRPQ